MSVVTRDINPRGLTRVRLGDVLDLSGIVELDASNVAKPKAVYTDIATLSINTGSTADQYLVLFQNIPAGCYRLDIQINLQANGGTYNFSPVWSLASANAQGRTLVRNGTFIFQFSMIIPAVEPIPSLGNSPLIALRYRGSSGTTASLRTSIIRLGESIV